MLNSTENHELTLMNSFRLTSSTTLYLCLFCGKVEQTYTKLSCLSRSIPGVGLFLPKQMASSTTAQDGAKSMASKKPTTAAGGKSQSSMFNRLMDRGNTEQFTPFFGKLSPFSQHYKCTFKIEGKTYGCAEQFMMYSKAVVFEDYIMADNILMTSKPAEQKRFGRQVKNFNPAIWNEKCENIVREANFAKFSQNEDLKSELLKTSGTTLVEASPRDRKWGIGLGVNNPKVHDRKNWRGKNLLGQILTGIRQELEKEVKQESEDGSESCDDTEKSCDNKEKSSDNMEKNYDMVKKSKDTE